MQLVIFPSSIVPKFVSLPPPHPSDPQIRAMALSQTSLQGYIEELVKEASDLEAKHQKVNPVLAFPSNPDKPDNLQYYTILDLHRLATRAQSHYTENGLPPRQQTEDEEEGQDAVVGICAAGNLEWIATFMALVRMGYTVLAISPRLVLADRLADLLTRAKCRILIHGPNILSSTSTTTTTTLVEHQHPIIPHQILLHPQHPDPLPPPPHSLPLLHPPPSTSLIFHSSGSTGPPKLLPVPQKTQLARLRASRQSVYADRTVFIASGPYNSGGLSVLLGALNSTKPLCLWNDALPYTGTGLVAFLREARPEVATFIPFALEVLVRMSGEEGIKTLRECCGRVVGFGALVSQEVGDRLVRAGVRFGVGYALTEGGIVMGSTGRAEVDDDWDYMSFYPNVREHVYMRPLVEGAATHGGGSGSSSSGGGGKEGKGKGMGDDRETDDADARKHDHVNGQKPELEQEQEQHHHQNRHQHHQHQPQQLYELTLLPTLPALSPSYANTTIPTPGSFATHDIFLAHPTKPDRYKILGRLDDRINLGIPVVVDAWAVEEGIKAGIRARVKELQEEEEGGEVEKVEEVVEEILCFGEGRPRIGVLVFPSPTTTSSTSSASTISASSLHALVVAAVRANTSTSTSTNTNTNNHTGRSNQNKIPIKEPIESSMVVVLPPGSRVPRTDKGNVIRPLVGVWYREEIERAYKDADADAVLGVSSQQEGE